MGVHQPTITRPPLQNQRAMTATFFTMTPRSLTPSWGDYGDVLQHGMTARLPGLQGRLSLERTSPYIPAITMPGIGDVVLTSEARELLETSGLSGFSFVAVEKTLIVELHWETWNLQSDEPAQYPDSGEPEDYILGKQHSAIASKALGDLWEVAIPTTATILRPKSVVNSYKELKLDLNSWNGADLIRGAGYGGPLCTQRARDWFTEQWEMYVRFDEFPTT
jgi:hypothetical protein